MSEDKKKHGLKNEFVLRSNIFKVDINRKAKKNIWPLFIFLKKKRLFVWNLDILLKFVL